MSETIYVPVYDPSAGITTWSVRSGEVAERMKAAGAVWYDQAGYEKARKNTEEAIAAGKLKRQDVKWAGDVPSLAKV